MEWTVEHRAAQDYVVVATGGEFALHDHVRMIEDIVSRDFWRPGMAVLFDHRALDFGASGLATMRQASENHAANDARIGSGRAAVVMRTPADYGRGRQFEMLSDGRVEATVQIFLDETEALRWLLDD
ncbi:MAG TPA: hypothetical protein VE871_19505 [Longimicrobium sp.]|nr:hypothetical protein [Longimicrobium sp.]